MPALGPWLDSPTTQVRLIEKHQQIATRRAGRGAA
jgi:hypothetical protein